MGWPQAGEFGLAIGVVPESRNLAAGLDSDVEARAAAVLDLSDRMADLVAAARLTVDRWSEGDLAEAVRGLESACRQLNPGAAQSVDEAARRYWRQGRLRALELAGLDISECIEHFGVPTDSHPLARRAFDVHHVDGELELDSHTVVSESDDGAYVLAWVWVAKQSDE